MKALTILALIAAFTSPAVADVVSSKQAGKAHCAKNEADHSLKVAAQAEAPKASTSSVAR